MPTLKFPSRERVRLVARLAVVAFLLQWLVPVLHQPAAAADAGLSSAAPICHTGTAPASGDAPASPASGMPACPVCALLQATGGGFLPPVVFALATPAAFRTAAPAPVRATAVVRWVALSGQPRAPPVSI